jgi:hypothetical protein
VNSFEEIYMKITLKLLKKIISEEIDRANTRKVIRETMALDPSVMSNIDKYVAMQASRGSAGQVDMETVRGEVEAELNKRLQDVGGMNKIAAFDWITNPKNESVIQMIATNAMKSGDAKKEVSTFMKNVATMSPTPMKESRRKVRKKNLF